MLKTHLKVYYLMNQIMEYDSPSVMQIPHIVVPYYKRNQYPNLNILLLL